MTSPTTSPNDRPGTPTQDPASLGVWIRDVPPDLSAGRSNWICVAVADARHLLCWGSEYNQVFLYDFAAGRWLDPVESEDLGDDV